MAVSNEDALLIAVIVLASVAAFLLVTLLITCCHLCWRVWGWKCCDSFWQGCANMCDCCDTCMVWNWDKCCKKTFGCDCCKRCCPAYRRVQSSYPMKQTSSYALDQEQLRYQQCPYPWNTPQTTGAYPGSGDNMPQYAPGAHSGNFGYAGCPANQHYI